MAKRIPRWVVVCGIGCGTLVLVGAGLVVGGALLLRAAVQDFERADQTMEAVEQRYGPIEAFRPLPGGRIPAERIDAFLTVREKMAPVREGLGRSLRQLSGEGGRLAKLRAGAYLLPRAADFVGERHAGLLEAEMGLGEYNYLYALAYYAWLEKPPEDGPAFQLVGDDGYVLETVGTLDEPVVRNLRAEQVRASLNQLLLPVLRNQQADLAGAGPDAEWPETLSAEIAAMETDSQRLPWQDGVPPVIAASLEPYRDRFEASYCPMCNALEVGLARR